MSTNKVVEFVVEDVHMCAYLGEVNKVLPLVQLKKIPESPNYLAGLMNLNGESIPIIDLALRVGLKRHQKYSLNSPVLLCTSHNNMGGFIIDRIIGLTDIQESSLQLSAEFNKPHSFFIASIINGSETSLLINMPELLDKVALCF